MVNTDTLIRDLLTRLQKAHEKGEADIHDSLIAILSRHGTLSLLDGRYTFAVATAAIYDANGIVRERMGLPPTITEKVLSKEGE